MMNVLDQYKELLNSGALYDSDDRVLLDYQHELVERLNQFPTP